MKYWKNLPNLYNSTILIRFYSITHSCRTEVMGYDPCVRTISSFLICLQNFPTSSKVPSTRDNGFCKRDTYFLLRTHCVNSGRTRSRNGQKVIEFLSVLISLQTLTDRMDCASDLPSLGPHLYPSTKRTTEPSDRKNHRMNELMNGTRNHHRLSVRVDLSQPVLCFPFLCLVRLFYKFLQNSLVLNYNCRGSWSNGSNNLQ